VGSDKIYYSSNGGTSWVSQTYSPYSYLLVVSCVDSVNVWVLGDRKLYRTSSGGIVTGIYEQTNNLVENFTLYQNYPNPFNPVTDIEFRIADFGFVSLKVYDVLGNEIATLINEERPAGEYEVNFDATNLTGGISAKGGYASGVYFYQLRAGDFTETKKMVLLR
jgi:hypothetical protein